MRPTGPIATSTGDLSKPAWNEAPEAVKKSTIAGVLMHLNDRNNMTAQDFHEAWLEYKAAEGWTYGPVIDAEKKEHPCMLPFDELPMEQKVKDYLFKSVADAFVQAFADAMAKEGMIGVAK